MPEYTIDYLLDKKIKIFQPLDGYRASSDAILLSSLIYNIKQADNILDVGSGTGGISLCLAYRFPQNSIVGLELQPKLSQLSNLSAQANTFNNLVYYNCDIKEKHLPVKPCSFNHVVSNPPYSLNDMPSPNKSKALAHNHSGLNLTSWIHFCLKMLKPFGYLYMINRAEAVSETMIALSNKAGNIQIIPLYSKENQNAKRVMIIAQKDSKTPTKILPPFYTHTADGSYTAQAQKILRDGKSFNLIDN
jgi:tRNA1(Val) A37 N6-methylase TrmN6